MKIETISNSSNFKKKDPQIIKIKQKFPESILDFEDFLKEAEKLLLKDETLNTNK